MKTCSPVLHLFSLAALAAAFACPESSLRAQTIPKGDIVVDLEKFAVIPNSGDKNLPARINVLRPAPDGRIFTNDQRGPMYLLSNDGKTVTKYLDLNDYVPLLSDDGERGFQSFAFHPDFYTAGAAGYGKFYTLASQSDTDKAATFTPGVTGAGRNHDEVMLEWTVKNPSDSTFAPADSGAPFREVLRIARPNGNHNGGYISFNPLASGADKGNLYYGMGDSGGGGDPLGLAQMLGKAYGCILRINPLRPDANDPQKSANGQYSIPADNPYKTDSAFLKEKYAAGFRNPQRFVWDPATGKMFITDIGQNTEEEVDIGKPGANYGWNLREGSFVYNSDGTIGANSRGDAASTGLTYPIAEYHHFPGPSGNAVTAGPVYRDTAIPQLTNRFLFCDFPTGTPYTFDANNLPDGGSGAITELRLRVDGVEMGFLKIIQQISPSATRTDLRFGTDASNNVYFLNKRDGVIRRVATTGTTQPPAFTVSAETRTHRLSRAAGGNAKIFITRTGNNLSADLTVSYKLGGSAVNGQDYVMRASASTIRAGNSKAKVKIVPLDSGGTGKVKLTLQPSPDYTISGDKVVRVRIVN